MAKYEIIHDRDSCIGCGTCAAVCPSNWEMKPDGKSSPKKTLLEELGCNKEASESCPVQCIHILGK